MAESSRVAALSRQELFDELVTAAIDTDEIQRSLQQAHGIDEGYLRERCTAESVRLWGEVEEAADEHDDATRRHDRVIGLHPAFAAMRYLLTSPQQQQSGALVGLLLVMFAWTVYSPGPMRLSPNYPLLAVAIALVALTLITRLPAFQTKVLDSARSELAVDAIMVPAFSITAVLLFLAAVADLVPPDDVLPASTSVRWTDVVPVTTAVSFVVIPFQRTVLETRPLPEIQAFVQDTLHKHRLLARSPLLMFPPFVLGVTIMLAGDQPLTRPALVIGTPNQVLLDTGLGLILLSAFASALGYQLRPAQLIRLDLEWTRGRVSQELTETVISPLLRAEINRHTQIADVVIDVREAPGLGHLSDPTYLVSTAAAERVATLIESMPGGSIGLAGSRGAGKTTLIESYCAGPRQPARSLATMVSAPVEYSSREFLLHLYAKICREVIGAHSGADGLDLVAAGRQRRAQQKLMGFGLLSIMFGVVLVILHNTGVRIPTQIAWAFVLVVVGVVLSWGTAGARDQPVRASDRDLHDIAAERREEIRFQQSFSSSWSGAVKVPLGLEATLGGGRGLTRQPLNLPEIVDSLREFLVFAARDHRVLIGIDELDKMESEAAAEQFLNEIKSIFGVRGCYFLVSVSEDAMSSFERRGLPFRDVFDSTFDEIVWFEHLTTAEAIASIDRRVLLMPLPFKQLCFALSGGLPRDLIRVARLVIDAQDPQGPTGLSRITTRLVTQDVARKVRAISVAARRIDLEPDVGRFLLLCAGVRDTRVDAASLMRVVDELLPAPESRAHVESTTAPAGAFLKLAGELASFLYYAATVLDYFDETAAEARWHDTSTLHLLAQARQAFSTSTRVAWEGISSFRRSWDMTTVAFPPAIAPMP